MIITARQYKNLKTNSFLRNKIKSINVVLRDTTVLQDAELGSHTETFTEPSSTIDAFAQYRNDRSGYTDHARTEAKFFTFEETFTSQTPITPTKVIVTAKTKYKYSEWSAFNTSFFKAYGFDILYGTDEMFKVKNKTFWDRVLSASDNYISIKEQTTTDLPATGNISIYPFDLNNININIPTNQEVSITAVQVDLFTIKLVGKVAYYTAAYSAIASGYTDKPYRDTDWQDFRFKEWFLSSVQVNIQARSINTLDVPYVSSNEQPALELTPNELFQYKATALDPDKANLYSLHSRFGLFEKFYYATCPKPVEQDIRVNVSFTLDATLDQPIIIRKGNTKSNEAKVSTLFAVDVSHSCTPQYDSKYVYDPDSPELQQYITPLSDYLRNLIIRGLVEGRQLVEFELIDEALDLEEGSTVQLKDIEGNFVSQGKSFVVYAIDFSVSSSCTRTIKALEVRSYAVE